MPSLNEIRAGSAFVEISTRDSKLVAGLAKSARDIEKFGAAVRGIGLGVGLAGSAILAPLTYAAKQYAETGDKLAKGSKRTGVDVEALSTLGYAASQSGTDIDSLEKGLGKMSKLLTEAAAGSREAEQSLADLGLSFADLKGLTQDDRFKLFAERIAQIKDPAQRSADAMKIFGKGAADLLPLLLEGADGIDTLQKRARMLGQEWSGADAAAAEEFGDRVDDMGKTLKAVVVSIGSAVAPVFRTLAAAITGGAIAARNWIRDHQQLFAIVAGGAAVLAVAGAAFVTLGTAIQVGGFALAGIGSALGIVVAAVGAIVSPIGLVVGGLALAGAAFLKFTDIGQAVGALIQGVFKDIWTSIKFVFNNTSTLSEAWGVAMTEAGFFVLRGWAIVKGGLVGMWISLGGSAAEIWYGIESTIISAAYRASDAFLKIWEMAIHAWRSMIASAADFSTNAFIRLEARRTIGIRFKDDQVIDPATLKQMAQLGLGEGASLKERQADLAKRFGPTLDPKIMEKQGWFEDPKNFINPRTLSHSDIEDLIREYSDKQVESNTQSASADEDAAYRKKLDALKKEADDRKAYLDQMRDSAKAAREKETAEAIAENDKQLADAEATYKAAREAYEKEQKAKHGGGGNLLDNLADQFKSMIPPELLKKLEDLKAAGEGGDFTNTSKITASGTFNASAAFGFGGGDQVAKNTQKTAENTQSMYEQLRALNQKSGLLIFQ